MRDNSNCSSEENDFKDYVASLESWYVLFKALSRESVLTFFKVKTMDSMKRKVQRLLHPDKERDLELKNKKKVMFTIMSKFYDSNKSVLYEYENNSARAVVPSSIKY